MFIYPGIFAGRRYANAVYAVVVCPSISSTVFTRCNRRNDGRRSRWCDRSHVCLDEATVGVIIGAIRHKSQPDILSKRPDELSWVLARRLPSIYPTLFLKEIWVPLKIRVLLSVTLSQTVDLENFATASRSRCQQNSSTVELADDTYSGRCFVTVYYTWSTVTLCDSITFRFVEQLAPTVVQQLTVDRISTDITRHAVGRLR